MVHIHCAYTEAINPSGSDPILSRDQVGTPSVAIRWRNTFTALVIAMTE
jgi:hypothetical protein